MYSGLMFYILMLRLVIPAQPACASQYAFSHWGLAPSSFSCVNTTFASQSNFVRKQAKQLVNQD
jgi:hypothetical protein